jgi:hypothetical protein
MKKRRRRDYQGTQKVGIIAWRPTGRCQQAAPRHKAAVTKPGVRATGGPKMAICLVGFLQDPFGHPVLLYDRIARQDPGQQQNL